MSKTLKELGAELNAKRAEQSEFFESRKNDSGDFAMSIQEVEQVRQKAAELTDLQNQYDALREASGVYEKNRQKLAELNDVANAAEVPGQAKGEQRAERKSIQQLIAGNEEYTRTRDRKGFGSTTVTIELPDHDVKATMTNAAGYAPEVTRNGILVPSAQNMPRIQDIIPSFETDQSAVKYMEETVYTNNAAGVLEDNDLGESALEFQEKTASIELVGNTLPVSEQQLEDVPQLAAIIEQRLGLMNLQKEALYLVNGNGTSPQIFGFLNVSGILSQPMAGDVATDAVYKGITKVMVEGEATPDAAVMHPNTWQGFRLMRTDEGIYIWGSPSENAAARIWGLPVIPEIRLAEGKALVGDFKLYSAIARRKGITVEVGRNAGDFKKVRYTVRCVSRMGLVVYRPQAFCVVTGLAFA